MDILYIALLTIVASFVGTVSGFGTSTIMIPALVMFFPPVEAIFLIAIIHWFGDVWKVLLFRAGFNLRLFALFGFAGLATSYLGASISLGSSQALLLSVLGGFLALYSVFLFFQQKSSEGSMSLTGWKVPATAGAAASGGAVSGFLAGMFGIGGAVRGMFLSAFDLSKAVYIATAGAIGLLVDSTRIVTYFFGGAVLPMRLWSGLIIFIPASFLGARLAKKVVDRIPQHKFRTVVAAFLFLIGVKLLLLP